MSDSHLANNPPVIDHAAGVPDGYYRQRQFVRTAYPYSHSHGAVHVVAVEIPVQVDPVDPFRDDLLDDIEGPPPSDPVFVTEENGVEVLWVERPDRTSVYRLVKTDRSLTVPVFQVCATKVGTHWRDELLSDAERNKAVTTEDIPNVANGGNRTDNDRK